MEKLNTECKVLILVIATGALIGVFVLLHYFPKKCQVSITSIRKGEEQVDVKHERSCYCLFEKEFWSIHDHSIISQEVSI